MITSRVTSRLGERLRRSSGGMERCLGSESRVPAKVLSARDQTALPLSAPPRASVVAAEALVVFSQGAGASLQRRTHSSPPAEAHPDHRPPAAAPNEGRSSSRRSAQLPTLMPVTSGRPRSGNLRQAPQQSGRSRRRATVRTRMLPELMSRLRLGRCCVPCCAARCRSMRRPSPSRSRRSIGCGFSRKKIVLVVSCLFFHFEFSLQKEFAEGQNTKI